MSEVIRLAEKSLTATHQDVIDVLERSLDRARRAQAEGVPFERVVIAMVRFDEGDAFTMNLQRNVRSSDVLSVLKMAEATALEEMGY